MNEIENLEIANRWCASKGKEWKLLTTAGRGGTAPVFEIQMPNGELRALKILDANFCQGVLGEQTKQRIEKQVKLGEHKCPYLIKVFEGGEFEDRLYILMNRAPGEELRKCLKNVPRDKIRDIIDQITQACIFLRENELCHRDIKSENIFISADYNTVTLLDISTLREIRHPEGIGTDQGGELPIVATARYCPPEYLFRLIAPSQELWHALDIYQLGGLLHDLIMREPLFEHEFRLCKDSNRYRFAWIVATQYPQVNAKDVDQDLVLLANRALDKDWQRRSKLHLEDFLNNAESHREHALELIGLKPVRHSTSISSENKHLKAAEMAQAIKNALVAQLKKHGITPKHKVEPGSKDNSKKIVVSWSLEKNDSFPVQNVELTIALSITELNGQEIINVTTFLSVDMQEEKKQEVVELPDFSDKDNVDNEIVNYIFTLIPDLARKLIIS